MNKATHRMYFGSVAPHVLEEGVAVGEDADQQRADGEGRYTPPPTKRTRTVYLAGRFSHRAWLQQRADELAALGYIDVTSTWLSGGTTVHDFVNLEAHWDDARRVAAEDFLDVMSADLVILFTDDSEVPSRGGRMVEFGIALALRKDVWIVGPRENVFCFLPRVRQFKDWAGALAALTY